MATKKSVPKMPPVKKAETGIKWVNKTVKEWEEGPNVVWRAQLSKCSDGRKFRNLVRVIKKRDGTEAYTKSFAFNNDTAGQQLKGLISLMKALLPKEAA